MTDLATDVFVQIAGVDVRAGRLWTHRRRGSESATFAYGDDFLARSDAYAIDPTLPLVSGLQHTPTRQLIFAAFSDCAPDRWGRRLIDRARGRRESAGPRRRLAEIDYLLGVRDDMRQGALRFRSQDEDIFLAADSSGIPPLIELPRLLAASERLEREHASDDDLRLLLRGGSSLGGARPKARVIGPADRVAIAKFPSTSTDDWNVVAWEAVVHELARIAGINVSPAQLLSIDGKSVFVVERFDRRGPERIGYVSAMTMLEANDREQRSYVDLADVIERVSDRPTEDLHELWTRVALSLLVSNTDDHLRNHGFIRPSSSGWELAPAFDVNPDPNADPQSFATTIDGESERSIDVLLDVADAFRLSTAAAGKIVGRVATVTSGWRKAAAGLGVPAAELDAMAPAFEHDHASAAAALSSSA